MGQVVEMTQAGSKSSHVAMEFRHGMSATRCGIGHRASLYSGMSVDQYSVTVSCPLASNSAILARSPAPYTPAAQWAACHCESPAGWSSCLASARPETPQRSATAPSPRMSPVRPSRDAELRSRPSSSARAAARPPAPARRREHAGAVLRVERHLRRAKLDHRRVRARRRRRPQALPVDARRELPAAIEEPARRRDAQLIGHRRAQLGITVEVLLALHGARPSASVGRPSDRAPRRHPSAGPSTRATCQSPRSLPSCTRAADTPPARARSP